MRASASMKPMADSRYLFPLRPCGTYSHRRSSLAGLRPSLAHVTNTLDTSTVCPYTLLCVARVRQLSALRGTGNATGEQRCRREASSNRWPLDSTDRRPQWVAEYPVKLSPFRMLIPTVLHLGACPLGSDRPGHKKDGRWQSAVGHCFTPGPREAPSTEDHAHSFVVDETRLALSQS
jgi:hypothetical protein